MHDRARAEEKPGPAAATFDPPPDDELRFIPWAGDGPDPLAEHA